MITNYSTTVGKYLRNVSTRDRLVKDICRVLEGNWIVLDANENLLAFTNKIYDLYEGNWVKPHYLQYISLTTNWKWVSGYSLKYVKKLKTIFKQIFSDDTLEDHYLTVLSTGLFGRVIQNMFVAKGPGGNGKSMLNSLMMECVGNYGYKLPSTVVSQSIKEGANPAVAKMKNKRFILVQEPDKHKKISKSVITEITGGKTLNCRDLYSSDTDVILLLTFIMECNLLPQIDEIGEAINRRLDVTPFNNRFLNHTFWEALTDEQRRTGFDGEKRVFKGDTYYMSDKFQNEYKQALMIILMEYFKEFQLNNYVIKPPKLVIDESKEYMKYSDDFYGWFDDKFINEDGGTVDLKTVWQIFSCSEYYNNMSKKSKRKYNQKYLKSEIYENMFLKKALKSKGGSYLGTKLTCDTICGYRIKEYGEDDNGDGMETEDEEEF